MTHIKINLPSPNKGGGSNKMYNVCSASHRVPIDKLVDLSDVDLRKIKDGQVIRYNADSKYWKPVDLSFLSLKDSPDSYDDVADYYVKVNSDGDGLEFITPDVIEDTKKVLVSDNDSTEGYLEDKVVGGDNIDVVTLNDGKNEQVQLSVNTDGLDADKVDGKDVDNDTTSDDVLWTAKKIDDTFVHNTGDETISGNKTFSNNVVISGDLTIEGSATKIETTDLVVEDKLITLNKGGDDADGSGVEIEKSGKIVASLKYKKDDDRWNDGSDNLARVGEINDLKENKADKDLSNVKDSDVLDKIKNVDGDGSGLDSDTVDGKNVDDNGTDDTVLWTAKKIGDELDKKLDIAATLTHIEKDSDLNDLTDRNTIYYNDDSDDVDSLKNKPDDVSGQIKVRYIGDDKYGQQICFGGSDNNNVIYIRYKNDDKWNDWTSDFNTAHMGAGSGLDADLLDGLESTQFVRSDVDSKKDGYLQLNNDGNGHSYPLYFQGAKDDGVDVAIRGTGEGLSIYEPEDSDKEWLKLKDDDGMYLSLSNLVINNGSDFNTKIQENDMTFNAGDDGGKAVFTKTNASTDCRFENQDKDGNVLSRLRFTSNYVDLGNSENSLHISTTSYRFDKLHGSATKIKADADLDTGWYTVATFGKNKGRGMARFMILDVKSSHHQVIDFQVTHMFGQNESNNITVFQQAYYSDQVITKIRIKEGGTYDGCAVQVHIDQDKNDLSVHYLGHNPFEDGWKIKNFIPDDTDPGDVDNYDDMDERVRVNMMNKHSGMFMGKDIYFREGKGLQFMNDTDDGVNVSLHAEGEYFYIREPEDGNKEWFKIKDDDNAYVFGHGVWHSGNLPYEKGDWTPEVYIGDTKLTLKDSDGWYVRIGNLVTIGFVFNEAEKNKSGDITIRNLPYDVPDKLAETEHEANGALSYPHNFKTKPDVVVAKSSNKLYLHTGDATLKDTDVDDKFSLRGTVTYYIE